MSFLFAAWPRSRVGRLRCRCSASTDQAGVRQLASRGLARCRPPVRRVTGRSGGHPCGHWATSSFITSSRPQLMQKLGLFAMESAFRVADAYWLPSAGGQASPRSLPVVTHLLAIQNGASLKESGDDQPRAVTTGRLPTSGQVRDSVDVGHRDLRRRGGPRQPHHRPPTPSRWHPPAARSPASCMPSAPFRWHAHPSTPPCCRRLARNRESKQTVRRTVLRRALGCRRPGGWLNPVQSS